MNDKVFVHITWVSIKKCIGLSSYTLASKHFLITWSLLGFTQVLDTHHAIATLFASIVQPSILCFLIDNDHKGMLELLVILCLSNSLAIFIGFRPGTLTIPLIEKNRPT